MNDTPQTTIPEATAVSDQTVISAATAADQPAITEPHAAVERPPPGGRGGQRSASRAGGRGVRRSASRSRRLRRSPSRPPVWAATAVADQPAGQGETVAADGVEVRRLFTSPGTHPFDGVEWEIRDARIGHGEKVAFEQTGRRVPEELVAECDEHRRAEVLPRADRQARRASTRSSR